MKFVHNWRWVVKRAWSIRFIAAAIVLSGVEVALSVVGGIPGIPNGMFAVISGVTSALALAARLVAQDGDKDNG